MLIAPQRNPTFAHSQFPPSVFLVLYPLIDSSGFATIRQLDRHPYPVQEVHKIDLPVF